MTLDFNFGIIFISVEKDITTSYQRYYDLIICYSGKLKIVQLLAVWNNGSNLNEKYGNHRSEIGNWQFRIKSIILNAEKCWMQKVHLCKWMAPALTKNTAAHQ